MGYGELKYMDNIFEEKTNGFYQGLQWVLDNLKLSEENL